MAIVNPSLLIVTLNVNGLNSSVERHRVAEWIKKTNKQTKNKETMGCLQETPGVLFDFAFLQSSVPSSAVWQKPLVAGACRPLP